MGNMVLSQQQAFLADILANPEDDGVRMIYADWLTERDGPGDSERAEFIRVQCALKLTSHTGHGAFCSACALLSRKNALLPLVEDRLRQEWRSWVGDGPWWSVFDFRRGFVEHVTLKADDWCRYAERLLATQPIREVTLTTRLEANVKLGTRFPVEVYLVGESKPFAVVSQADWRAADRLPGGGPRLRARVALLWPGIVFHGPDFPEGDS
jgi:uncharacterized protein (TIGR02996 family)